MLEIAVIIAVAVVALAAVGGLIASSVSAHYAARHIADRLSDRADKESDNEARAVLCLVQATERVAGELAKATDRVLAAANERVYQIVKHQEGGRKKDRDIRERVIDI